MTGLTFKVNPTVISFDQHQCKGWLGYSWEVLPLSVFYVSYSNGSRQEARQNNDIEIANQNNKVYLGNM